MTSTKNKDKYQWSNHIRNLSKDKIRELITSLEGSIALNIEKERYTAYVKFAKQILKGK